MAIITSLKRRLDEEVADLLNGEERVRLDSLRDLLEVVPLTMQDLPENITAPFTASDGRILPFVAINPAQAMHDGNNAIRFADEIAEIHLSSGKTYYASSSNIVFADVVRVVFADGRTAVFLTLAVVFLVVLLDFRRLRDALLVVVPLLAALLWVFGFMHIFDIGFNLYNVIVFPTLIGMGVANTVHILHRYREEGANSLRRVLRTTGKALAATSLTTMAGFSGLVIVRHPGLNSMGLVALVGLANCFLAAVVLLPALLQVLEARSKPARQRDEQQPVSNQHAMAE
jgi:predicted RND superfamily exporter protein